MEFYWWSNIDTNVPEVVMVDSMSFSCIVDNIHIYI